jgi:NAD(P)-dependent dehydrogenase (short-subunit alcohol dehydrogenase family)
MPTWTVEDIPDQSGKTAVVTGANSGLGLQTALALAGRGAHVVLACRDMVKGEEAVALIGQEAAGSSVELAALDLSDLKSVQGFAEAFVASHAGLDILVNNAGVMATPARLTVDGFELQFGTNHLGHFALTGRLLPSLLARPGARVVTLSSLMAQIGSIHFQDLQMQRRYERWSAYGQSKLANQMFAFELDRRAKRQGRDLVSVAAHPGYASTNLQTAGPLMSGRRLQAGMMVAVNGLIGQSSAQGALPSLYGATAPGVSGGEYFGPRSLMGLRGQPTRVRPTRSGRNADTARRLWDVSEQLTGVDYELLDPAS